MLTAYPWGSLEPLSRAATRVATSARQTLRLSAARVEVALADLLEMPCELLVQRTQMGLVPALAQALWLQRDGLALGLLVEPALAAYLAARVLRRAEPLADPREPLTAPGLAAPVDELLPPEADPPVEPPPAPPPLLCAMAWSGNNNKLAKTIDRDMRM